MTSKMDWLEHFSPDEKKNILKMKGKLEMWEPRG